MSKLYPSITKGNLELTQKVLQELFVINDFRLKQATDAEGVIMFHKETQAIQETLEAVAFELEIVSSQEVEVEVEVEVEEEDSDIVLMSDVISEVNKNFRKGV